MSEILHVLIVEDNPGDVDLIREALSETESVSFQIEAVSTLSEALARLKHEGVDLVLLDLGLLDSKGLETFHRLLEAASHIPVIILTGEDNQEMAVLAVRGGAQDYLIKGQIGGTLLMRAVRYAVERKRSEEALRESENKYRFLTEKMVDMVWTVNMDMQTTYVSPSIFRVLGFTQEERMKQTLSEIITQKSIERVAETLNIEMERNRETGVDRHRSVKMELEYYHKDGSTIWFENVIGFIGDDQGNIIGVHGVSREITERKQAEEKLTLNFEIQAAMNAILGLSLEDRTIKEFLDSALDLVLSLKWLAVESKGAIFLADKAGETLHLYVHKGFSEELYAMCSTVPFGHCLCGRAAATRAIQFADRVDERHDTRYEGMSPHGHYCVPILSGDHIIGVISLYVKEDHTRSPLEENFLKAVANSLAGTINRKRSEEALRESEERYRSLFDRSLDLVYINDLEGHFIDANAATLNRLGYTKEDIHTLNFASLVSEDQLPLAIKTLQENRETGIQKNLMEFRILRKDGTSVYVETQGSVILSNGKPMAIQSIGRDITERRQAEEKLKRNIQLLKDTGETAKIGGWEFDVETQEQVWTDEVYRIHEVDMTYNPTVSKGLAFYTPKSRPVIEQAVQ
jgi:PAS domain S-box-containing protein